VNADGIVGVTQSRVANHGLRRGGEHLGIVVAVADEIGDLPLRIDGRKETDGDQNRRCGEPPV
jgi:hypothetical protein